MTATSISAADKAAIVRSLDGVLPEMHAKALHDYLFTTLPALILSDIANASQAVANVAAVQALDVATLADKALIYVEDTGQLFAYDAQSEAVESLGPPATVIAPTSGAGRYLVFVGTTAYMDARLRLVADNAAVKAIDVATLVDKALIVKEDSQQIFLYDSGSAATEILGPPALVIQPTAGAGRYLDVSTQAVEKRFRVCADNAAVKALVVGGLLDKALVYKEDTQQLFSYDSGSAAAEDLGPPATVIEPTVGAGRYLALTLGGLTIPQSYFDARLRMVADLAALKAIDVTTLVDKALVLMESTGELLRYDSGSAAAADEGPPTMVVVPDAGAGRYLSVGLVHKSIRIVADTAAVKALNVDNLVDRALIFVEALGQLFAYDSGSGAAEALGPPVQVIQPTAGAGRYLALTNPAAPFTWFAASQATDPGAGDNLPVGADGTFANSNGQTKRAPCKGICSVWYIGEAAPAGVDDGNTAVFKIIKSDNTVLTDETFNTANQPPAAFVPGLIGAAFEVAEGDVLGWECITGATADLPKFSLQFDITPIA